jgi:cell wall-associated NlpC family hydrolase
MAGASPSSGQISQLLRGHPADVIEEDDAWWRVIGADGYAGWCHQGYFARELPASGTTLKSAWGAERRMSIGCTVRRLDGAEVALPLGAILEADEEVTRGLAMNHRARARYFASDPELLARRSVERFHGAPYQWGGVTPWGSDCSGFIQTMFALHGTQLPRDAWMQGESGRDVNADPSELHAGDLLFFSDRNDGRVTHVALSLGRSRFAHCSLANGGFGINSLDASDPVATSLRAMFRFARRVL